MPIFLGAWFNMESIRKKDRQTDRAVLKVNNYMQVARYRICNGCGSVGRAVVSDSRGPCFESSHRQKYLLLTAQQIKMKKKEAGNGPFKSIDREEKLHGRENLD